MPGIDTRELAERDRRIRNRDETPVTQPPLTDWRTGAAGGAMLLGVIREIPADDAPYVVVQQIRPSADYATSGVMEFVDGSTRAVLCEPYTLAGDYSQWVWEGSDPTDPAIVTHWLVMSGGMLFIIHKGRQQHVMETGDYEPTDCYLFGS